MTFLKWMMNGLAVGNRRHGSDQGQSQVVLGRPDMSMLGSYSRLFTCYSQKNGADRRLGESVHGWLLT